MSYVVPIDESSRVAEVRRTALTVARAEGLDESESANVALIATEAATNLLKHAEGGEIHVSSLSTRGGPGVEVLSIDKGPGISNLDQCLADGYSSSGTRGTGLGAMRRLSDHFDIYTEPKKGTILLSQVRGQPGLSNVSAGVVEKPKTGEPVSGDAWAIREHGGTTLLMVADGLGHGVKAEEASREAVLAFCRSQEISPPLLLQSGHAALRGTRGAAVAIAEIGYSAAEVRFAGLGNISGVIVSGGKTHSMVSHYGTAGHESRRFQEFTYALPETAIVVLHSDGLSANWSLASHAGLVQRHPGIIAATIYRDASRGRDDLCVVVLKKRVQ